MTIAIDTPVVIVQPGISLIRTEWQAFVADNDGDDYAAISASLAEHGYHIGGGGSAPWCCIAIDDGHARDRIVEAEGEWRAKVTAENYEDDATVAPFIDHADLLEQIANLLLTP